MDPRSARPRRARRGANPDRGGPARLAAAALAALLALSLGACAFDIGVEDSEPLGGLPGDAAEESAQDEGAASEGDAADQPGDAEADEAADGDAADDDASDDGEGAGSAADEAAGDASGEDGAGADADADDDAASSAAPAAPPVPQGAYPDPGAVAAASGEPAPGDMLTAQEAATAEQLALGSTTGEALTASAVDRDAVLLGQTGQADLDAASETQRVQAMADRPTYRVIYAQRYPDKLATEREAEVLIYRYDTGEAVYNRVNLETDEVVSAMEAEADPRLPVPTVPEEIQEATVAARADDEVRARIQAAGLDPDAAMANALQTTSTDPSSPCAPGGRCLKLFFSSPERPVPEFWVVVDLVALQVVELEDMPGRSLNP